MKIGLDFHGVIDSNPELFAELTKMLVEKGHEVHIVTGPDRAKMIPLLDNYDIKYTHFFSIVEDAINNGIEVTWDKEGNPWVDSEFWNRSKARYCKRNNIDLHIDDSPEYGKHFKTPYLQMGRGKN
jgi:hypothetical protein